MIFIVSDSIMFLKKKNQLSSTCMFMWVFGMSLRGFWLPVYFFFVVTRCAYLNDIVLDKKVRFSGWYIRWICDNGFECAAISCNVICQLNKDLPLCTLYNVSTCTYRELTVLCILNIISINIEFSLLY